MRSVTTMVGHPQTTNFSFNPYNKQKTQGSSLEVPSFTALTGNEKEEKTILGPDLQKSLPVLAPVEKVDEAPTLLGRVKEACKSGSEAIYRNRYQIAGGFALFLIGIILGRTMLSSPQKPSGEPRPVVLPSGDWNPTPSGLEIGGSKEPVVPTVTPSDTPSVPNNTSSPDPTIVPTSKYDNVVVSIQTIRNVNTNVKKVEKRLQDIGSHMSVLSSCVKGDLKLPEDDNSIKLNPVL